MYLDHFDSLYELGKGYAKKEILEKVRDDIRFDNYRSWCKQNPDADNARLEAIKAIEVYLGYIDRYVDKREHEIIDCLNDSDQVINWKNLFKKMGHP